MTLKINQWHIKLMNTTTTIEIGGLLYMMFCLQAYRPAECFLFDALFCVFSTD